MIIEKDGKKYKLIEIVEERKTLVVNGWEIETEIHHKGKTYVECEADCPKGWEIPTYFLLQELRNSKHAEELHLIDTWEFVQNPDTISKKNNYVARFNAIAGRAGLDGYGDPSDTDADLGVRFCRKKIKGAREKNSNKTLEGCGKNRMTGYIDGVTLTTDCNELLLCSICKARASQRLADCKEFLWILEHDMPVFSVGYCNKFKKEIAELEKGGIV